MRPKKFVKPARVQLITEESEKRAATEKLKAAHLTLSDYLQECIRRVATGELVVVSAPRPVKTSPANVPQ